MPDMDKVSLLCNNCRNSFLPLYPGQVANYRCPKCGSKGKLRVIDK